MVLRRRAGRLWRVRGTAHEMPADLALWECDHCEEFLLGPEEVKEIDRWLSSLPGKGSALTPGEQILGGSARRGEDLPPLEALEGATVDRRGRVLRLQAKMGATIGRRALEHVLLEEPGHAVVTLRGGGGERVLAVEMASSGRRVRWLQAAITDLEWRGLVWGHLEATELFLNRATWIVDYDERGKPVLAWEFAAGFLPDAMRVPVRVDANVRAHLRDVVENVAVGKTLRLSGRPVQDHEIGFDAYGTFLKQVQDLVRSMTFARERPKTERARAQLSAKAKLMVDAETPGSVLVHIKPADAETFRVAFASIHRVFAAAESPDTLREAVAGFGPAVGAFNTLLTTARLMGLEFVMSDGEDVSLVSTARAGRYQASFDAVFSDPPSEEEVEGFFVGFNHNSKKPTFAMQTDRGQRIKGRLSRELSDLNFALDDFVVVGSSQWYRARIRTHVRRHQGQRGREDVRHELLRFEPLRGLLDSVPDSVPPAPPADDVVD